MIDANMSLQILRPRIFVLSIRTERTYITGRIVNKTMANHLILTLETLSSWPSRTSDNWTKVRTIRRMYIRMRALLDVSSRTTLNNGKRMHLLEQVLCLKRQGSTPWKVASEPARLTVWWYCRNSKMLYDRYRWRARNISI